MTIPLLSICIPTYNRQEFLKECLSSIKDQDTFDIEIIVSDNASTDKTEELVRSFSDTLPIKYHRFEENRGFDENCAKSVELASGTYCLLLGSDDIILPGGLKKILTALVKFKPDILHSGYRQGEFDITKKREDIILIEQQYKTLSTESASEYFSQLPNLSTLFAFISSFIFLKNKWPSESIYKKWIGTHYIHLFCMHHLISIGCAIKSTCELYIAARGDNENEWSKTPGKHLLLDAISFSKIISEIYNDDIKIKKSISRVFKKSYPYSTLLRIFSEGGVHYIKESNPHLLQMGYNGNYILVINTLNLLHLRRLTYFVIKMKRTLRAKKR